MNRMFKLTLALLAVLALTGSALAQISDGTEARLIRKEHHACFITTGSCPNYGGAVRSGFSPRSKISRWHRRYLSVI